MVNWRKIETITKGIASHRRLGIVDLLKEKPELSVEEIARTLKISFNNASDHIGKLVVAGLTMKRHDGNFVRHKLTKRGESILKFLSMLG
ncbi:MAG: winged helix-turn-helix domain-containing protein [bacterium]|nr:winged helix-turn-helix domain-containing protein [bacterium]